MSNRSWQRSTPWPNAAPNTLPSPSAPRRSTASTASSPKQKTLAPQNARPPPSRAPHPAALLLPNPLPNLPPNPPPSTSPHKPMPTPAHSPSFRCRHCRIPNRWPRPSRRPTLRPTRQPTPQPDRTPNPFSNPPANSPALPHRARAHEDRPGSRPRVPRSPEPAHASVIHKSSTQRNTCVCDIT